MPRTRSLAWSELKIGVLTIAAIVIAAVMIFSLTGSEGLCWQRYIAEDALSQRRRAGARSPVRVAGVEVGRVDRRRVRGRAGRRRPSRSQAPSGQRITDKSLACSGSVSLLGEAAVDITPSTAGTPVPEYGYVPSGRAKGSCADVAEQATTGIEEITGLRQRHSARQGHRRQADDRRPAVYRAAAVRPQRGRCTRSDHGMDAGRWASCVNDPQTAQCARRRR